ncbi:hypothetical protein Tco_0749357 [Tanacetum coccineum]|uniref:Xylulose kinase-1 n=1 Tax=Tanacetum coccineum TaxID=301880 RepID=A0ABQ4Z0Q8_9ASTR
MVALLEKTDGSEGFHQIVDFLNASHIRFALSENPTIYDSHIKQFWQTATANTLDIGEQEITDTVDGHVKTVTIASVTKYFQLVDAGGLIADEAAFTCVDVVLGGAATTVSSIDARHGSGTIPKSSTMPHDSPFPGGHTPGSDEGSMTLHELTVLCTKLSQKVKKLEQTVKTSQARRRTKLVVSDDEEDEEDPSKQGRSLIEEMDLDAGISLVPPQVSTASPEVSTADTELNTASTFVSTASPQRKEVSTVDDLTLVETLMEIRKSAAKAKERQRMTQVHQAAQGFTNAEWDDVLARVAADEDLVQQLQAGSYNLQHLKKLSFDEIKELFKATMKRREAKEELNQESSKRQKTGKGSEPAEESKDKESEELSQEQLQ